MANPNLQKIIKLTSTQYESLFNGGSITYQGITYTGLNDNYLYLIQEEDIAYSAGAGLQLSGTTFSANLNSTTPLGTIGSTSKLYEVGVDASGKLCVNVPWTDTDTDTHNLHAIISGTKSDNSTQIKGSASSGDITLGDSGVTAGTYRSVTVNSKGIVVAGSSTDADTNT